MKSSGTIVYADADRSWVCFLIVSSQSSVWLIHIGFNLRENSIGNEKSKKLFPFGKIWFWIRWKWKQSNKSMFRRFEVRFRNEKTFWVRKQSKRTIFRYNLWSFCGRNCSVESELWSISILRCKFAFWLFSKRRKKTHFCCSSCLSNFLVRWPRYVDWILVAASFSFFRCSSKIFFCRFSSSSSICRRWRANSICRSRSLSCSSRSFAKSLRVEEKEFRNEKQVFAFFTGRSKCSNCAKFWSENENKNEEKSFAFFRRETFLRGIRARRVETFFFTGRTFHRSRFDRRFSNQIDFFLRQNFFVVFFEQKNLCAEKRKSFSRKIDEFFNELRAQKSENESFYSFRLFFCDQNETNRWRSVMFNTQIRFLLFFNLQTKTKAKQILEFGKLFLSSRTLVKQRPTLRR